MITFKGSQKEFFKAYPLNMRDPNEIYELENANGKTQYQFVGSLGKKNFKKIEQPNDSEESINDMNVSEANEAIKYSSHLKEMKQLAETLQAEDEEDVKYLQKQVLKANNWQDLVKEDTIALLNDLAIRMYYIDCEEDEWGFNKSSPEDIRTFICQVSDYVKTAAMLSGNYELYIMCEFYDGDLVEAMARLQDEWRSKCCSLMKACRTQSSFDFDIVDRLNKLINRMSRIAHGYINDITKIRDDYKWFGQTFKQINRRGIVVNIYDKFSTLNSYLLQIYIENRKYLGDDNNEV